MMDQQCMDAIIKVILESNMSDLDILNVGIEPVTCEVDENGREQHTVHISLFDTMYCKSSLSQAWVAGNLLLFTAFDGYLENTYHLTEGASFKEHYNHLPENTAMERVTKNCYRVFKLIRNGIQHNLSSVHYHSGSYGINYHYRNTHYGLQISKKGVSSLYTLVVNILQGEISGMYGKYRTQGHYDGIMYMLYQNMENEITQLTDDIGQGLLPVPGGLALRAAIRRPVENPKIIAEDESSITFRHLEQNTTDDENSAQYGYSTDYIYKDYLLPQELGCITKGQGGSFQERRKGATIRFPKSCLEDKWKLRQ